MKKKGIGLERAEAHEVAVNIDVKVNKEDHSTGADKVIGAIPSKVLGIDTATVSRTQATYVRNFDNQRNELQTDQLRFAGSIYATAVTIGKHNEDLFFDRRRRLIVDNVQIRSEHLSGTKAPNGAAPLQVPTKFFTPSSADGELIEVASYWTKTNQLMLVGQAAVLNGIMVGGRMGVCAGALTILASAAFSSCSWGTLFRLGAQVANKVFGLGSLLGATIGGSTQYTVMEMEKTRAQILEEIMKRSREMQSGEDPLIGDAKLVAVTQDRQAFEQKYGLQEAYPLLMAFNELRDDLNPPAGV